MAHVFIPEFCRSILDWTNNPKIHNVNGVSHRVRYGFKFNVFFQESLYLLQKEWNWTPWLIATYGLKEGGTICPNSIIWNMLHKNQSRKINTYMEKLSLALDDITCFVICLHFSWLVSTKKIQGCIGQALHLLLTCFWMCKKTKCKRIHSIIKRLWWWS